MTQLSPSLTVTRVDELRAEIVFSLDGGGVDLGDLERFCQSLRSNGALSQLAIKAERQDGTREQGWPIGPVVISAVLENPRPSEVSR